VLQNTFSKIEAIKYGWNTVLANFKFFAILFLILIGVNIIPQLASSFFEYNQAPLLGFIIALVGLGIQLVVSLGIIGIALNFYDKKKTQYKKLFDYFHLVIPFILASIIYMLIVWVGIILFIIPGIIWSIKFRYYAYFIVDKNMGSIEALKASSEITKGAKWNLFLFGILLGIINFVGALALLVGLIITIPLTMVAEAYVFRKLSGTTTSGPNQNQNLQTAAPKNNPEPPLVVPSPNPNKG